MALRKGYQQLIREAEARIRTLSVEEAAARLSDPGTLFVDIRDIRELEREGTIPGAFHAPRGMLEFWVDPESPYFKDVFASGQDYLLFCGSAWRSSLAVAALEDMGFGPVAQIAGGFKAWKEAGLPVEPRPARKA